VASAPSSATSSGDDTEMVVNGTVIGPGLLLGFGAGVATGLGDEPTDTDAGVATADGGDFRTAGGEAVTTTPGTLGEGSARNGRLGVGRGSGSENRPAAARPPAPTDQRPALFFNSTKPRAISFIRQPS